MCINLFHSHSVEITEIYSHNILSQKFRESNGSTKDVTKYVVDLTNFFSVRESKFFIFPHYLPTLMRQTFVKNITSFECVPSCLQSVLSITFFPALF